jgi:hypothetical protein
MSDSLEEADWKLLLRRMKDGKCTPLLGPEAFPAPHPYVVDVAQKWAEEFSYPMSDSDDLSRVAQFLAVRDPLAPKEQLQDWITSMPSPDLHSPDEMYNVMAALPLPVYITTNYDDILEQTLKHYNKSPRRELCLWNKELAAGQVSAMAQGTLPTVTEPVVFYLYGHYSVPESLVLTEDDYLDFLVNISSGNYPLPLQIVRALSGSSLLFIGYRLSDLSFRVLFRGIVASTEPGLRRLSVTVQLPPVPEDAPRATREQVQKYLDEYFKRKDIRVYWGTVRSFAAQLQQRQPELGDLMVRTLLSQPPTERLDTAKLRQILIDYFNESELRDLCFDLNVNYESLLGTSTSDRARELILYFDRRGRTNVLVEVCRRLRPNVSW